MPEIRDEPGKVIPAHLNFLAIYNPELGTTDETQGDQIVYYYSRAWYERRRRKSKNGPSEEEVREHDNEKLRQTDDARGFSNGASLDSVETEKHRIVLTELEKGWWILASINLTRLPTSKPSADSQFEYSSREVSPPQLLTQQLHRAHRSFLIHHGPDLNDLFVRTSKLKFCENLERYWNQFSLNWDVLLHGNPTADFYGGIKLSAGGELGIGVGEEEWGSGEREGLEGLIRNTEGLVDLTVSRYGNVAEDLAGPLHTDAADEVKTTWLGTGQQGGPADGVLFSGIGAISRPSLRNLADWVHDICIFGEDAYGVANNPSSARRKRRRKRPPAQQVESEADHGVKDSYPSAAAETKDSQTRSQDQKLSPNIPPPIVSAVEESLQKAMDSADSHGSARTKASTEGKFSTGIADPEVWMKVLTLGYGSAWGGADKETKDAGSKHENASSGKTLAVPASKNATSVSVVDFAPKSIRPALPRSKSSRGSSFKTRGGYFIIGLKGNLDMADHTPPDSNADEDEDEASTSSSRLSLRTLHLSLAHSISPSHSSSTSQTISSAPLPPKHETSRFRVVIYAHRPFIYTLLFQPESSLLSIGSFFHDLHHHLSPLHAPLLRSTDPTNIASRLASALPQPKGSHENQIHDLVYSPLSLALRSGIPNIPAPGTLAAEGISSQTSHAALVSAGWTRVEALSVHSRILDTLIETRSRIPSRNASLAVKRDERQRTVKTSRGWWIVWTRVATTSTAPPDERPRPSDAQELEQEHADDAAATAADALQGVPSRRPGATYDDDEQARDEHTEALLIRRSADSAPASGRWGYGIGLGGGRRTLKQSPSASTGGAWSGMSMGMGLSPFARFAGKSAVSAGETRAEGATGKATQVDALESGSGEDGGIGGIGVDVREYVEGLLSLNR